VTQIVDHWLEWEIAELDPRVVPWVRPLKTTVAEATGRTSQNDTKPELTPALARYLTERRVIDARTQLAWFRGPR
jgi:hypothetical protein